MPTMFIVGLVGAVIVLSEWAMWRLFLKRFEGMHFPHDVDASSAPFFTLARLRVFVIGHTVFLLTVLTLLFFPQW